jgi:hypothetical protein
MGVQEEASGITRMQQQHKVLRPKTGIMPGKLEIIKQTVGTSITLQKMNVKTLWRGQPPSKTKKDTTNNRLRVMDVGALATLRTFRSLISKEG